MPPWNATGIEASCRESASNPLAKQEIDVDIPWPGEASMALQSPQVENYRGFPDGGILEAR